MNKKASKNLLWNLLWLNALIFLAAGCEWFVPEEDAPVVVEQPIYAINSPNIVSTFDGIKLALNEGCEIVYLISRIEIPENETLEITAGRTIVVSSQSKIAARSVSGGPAGQHLGAEGDDATEGRLVVGNGAGLAVKSGGTVHFDDGKTASLANGSSVIAEDVAVLYFSENSAVEIAGSGVKIAFGDVHFRGNGAKIAAANPALKAALEESSTRFTVDSTILADLFLSGTVQKVYYGGVETISSATAALITR